MTGRANPRNFDEYEGRLSGSPRGSVSSVGGRSVRWDDNVGSPSAASGFLDAPEDGENEQHGDGEGLRRRR